MCVGSGNIKRKKPMLYELQSLSNTIQGTINVNLDTSLILETVSS